MEQKLIVRCPNCEISLNIGYNAEEFTCDNCGAECEERQLWKWNITNN